MNEFRFPPLDLSKVRSSGARCCEQCSDEHPCDGNHRASAVLGSILPDGPDPGHQWEPPLKSKPQPPRPPNLPLSGFPNNPGPDPGPTWDPPLSIDESLPESAQCNYSETLSSASPWLKDKPQPNNGTGTPPKGAPLQSASFTLPLTKTKLALAPQRSRFAINPDLATRLMGDRQFFPAIRGVKPTASRTSGRNHGLMPSGPGQLADPPRPSRYCHNPDLPENTTPQGCDKDEEPDEPGNPPVPVPFVPDHPTPNCILDDSEAEHPKGFFGCAGWQETWIRRFHRHAYLIVKAASRTLDWIWERDDASRDFYWHWGTDVSPFSSWWHDQHEARFASLAYWFGPYSPALLEYVRWMFATMVDIYENGVHVWGRPRMKYKCNNLFCGSGTLARHGAARYTQICLGNFFAPFWNPNVPQDNWIRSRIWVVTHEWFHNIGGVGHPRDRCRYGTCSGGWRCTKHQCYQLSEIPSTWLFTEDPVTHLARPGNNPRKLIERGGKKALEDARDNNDNFVSWAIARWVDGQWGDCDGPDLSAMSTVRQANRI